MRFLIYPNKTYDDAVAFAAQITEKLTALGHECYEMESDQDPRLMHTDMAIIVGGDGTVLRLVRSLLSYQFPFWAVNYGHLGYLTECEPDEAFDALDRIGVARKGGGEELIFKIRDLRVQRGLLGVQGVKRFLVLGLFRDGFNVSLKIPGACPAVFILFGFNQRVNERHDLAAVGVRCVGDHRQPGFHSLGAS